MKQKIFYIYNFKIEKKTDFESNKINFYRIKKILI